VELERERAGNRELEGSGLLDYDPIDALLTHGESRGGGVSGWNEEGRETGGDG